MLYYSFLLHCSPLSEGFFPNGHGVVEGGLAGSQGGLALVTGEHGLVASSSWGKALLPDRWDGAVCPVSHPRGLSWEVRRAWEEGSVYG